jgi:drug/metabolite transporter (DMT)-like permease
VALPAIALVAAGPDGAPQAKRTYSLRQHPLAGSVVAGIGFGLFFVVLEGTSDASGVWPLIAARMVSVPVLLTYGTVRGRLVVASGAVRLIVAAGVLDMTANVLYLLAVCRGLLSVVAVLAALYPVSTVVLARVTLGERFTRSQAGGIGVALLAVVMVALA